MTESLICPVCGVKVRQRYNGGTCSKECARIWFVYEHSISVPNLDRYLSDIAAAQRVRAGL